MGSLCPQLPPATDKWRQSYPSISWSYRLQLEPIASLCLETGPNQMPLMHMASHTSKDRGRCIPHMHHIWWESMPQTSWPLSALLV